MDRSIRPGYREMKYLGQCGCLFHLDELFGTKPSIDLQKHYPDKKGTGSDRVFTTHYDPALQSAKKCNDFTYQEYLNSREHVITILKGLWEKGHPIPGRYHWLCDHDRCERGKPTAVGSYRTRSEPLPLSQKPR